MEYSNITTLLTDSRSLLDPHGTLFFALRTASGDGHKYIRNLYDRGVRDFVVETLPSDASDMPDARFHVTVSPLHTLQELGASHRRDSNALVIGITGSRGKTTLKEWIYRLLSPNMKVVRSPRSFNSQTGVPLSLWNIRPDTDVAVIEAGISHPGEMERLESIISPEIGIFTNIGNQHSQGFSSAEEKCREKALLLQGCRSVIYCADNSLIASSVPDGPGQVGWTRDNAPGARLRVKSMTKTDGCTTVYYMWMPEDADDRIIENNVKIPFTAEHDIENALHALTLMLLLGYSPETISERMATLRPVRTRLNVIDGVNDCQLIHDTFASDITTLALALDFVERRLTPDHTLTVILGDMDTQGEEPAEVYRRVAHLMELRNVGRVIAIGPRVYAERESLPQDVSVYPSVEQFLAANSADDFKSELVLLKGSPDESLDAVARLLEKKRHETVLEINLDAVVDNFNYFRSLIRPTTGMVCMIKASGYGAGSHELAKTLQSQGASYLAVAVHDEGVDLRQAGITMPIIVLNPAVDSLKSIFDNNLEPEIYSIEFLRSLIDEARRRGITDYPVHIKIDSGMHRLGFRLETLPEVIEVLNGQENVVPSTIFSHLCAADDPAEDDYTRSQFEYFDKCCDMLAEAFPDRKIRRHILNSTGITRFPEQQHDLVRLGIGLYGVRTMHDGSQEELRPVSTLRSSIISLKHWPAGTTIGYNRRGRLTRDSIIATVPIGYADGLNRHLGWGRASFNVRGVLCPTVGTICMDAFMLDVTDVPDVSTGDSVEIFGDTIPVDTIAKILDTIPYEVLTSISQRVKRVYYRE
ncbi:MAG: bifunctional UDP-N-acetylmuramoyl-tripeptide:D-alanyl-D-alanine ligase/alanine racemase [Bacteroides sp.]|nr:bifunctional UDP-N-acetylmuramoyl-tripeptide:D-alanyl-D-alanine ligase/alanine racemase [Bacteroides sp.]